MNSTEKSQRTLISGATVILLVLVLIVSMAGWIHRDLNLIFNIVIMAGYGLAYRGLSKKRKTSSVRMNAEAEKMKKREMDKKKIVFILCEMAAMIILLILEEAGYIEYQMYVYLLLTMVLSIPVVMWDLSDLKD